MAASIARVFPLRLENDWRTETLFLGEEQPRRVPDASSPVAVYVRTARPSPDAIHKQLQSCLVAANHLGFNADLSVCFRDDGISGRVHPLARPGFSSLYDYLAQGECSLIVVDEVSRISRSMVHVASLFDVLRTRKIRLIGAAIARDIRILDFVGSPSF